MDTDVIVVAHKSINSGAGGMSWLLSSVILYTGVQAIGTSDDCGGEKCIESTVCRSINSSFTE